MRKNNKSIGSRALGNRTIIGIICIVAALAICFGIAPMVNKLRDGKAMVVRVSTAIEKGAMITDANIEVVEVGSFNLPGNVVKSKDAVIGKFAVCDMYPGDYIFADKVSGKTESAGSLLESLKGSQKAISVSIGSFALGLSGKLDTGDIVSAVIYDSTENRCFTPPELQYVKVITSTTAQGVDKSDIADSAQPVTVTLLVDKTQAELLAFYEKTGSIHFVLEFRGDAAEAQKYLDAQAEYLHISARITQERSWIFRSVPCHPKERPSTDAYIGITLRKTNTKTVSSVSKASLKRSIRHLLICKLCSPEAVCREKC